MRTYLETCLVLFASATEKGPSEELRQLIQAEGISLKLVADRSVWTQFKAEFEEAFRNGHRKIVLLREHFPQLSPAEIREAFLCLRVVECVAGSTPGGQIYLLGMNENHPALWQGSFMNEQSEYKNLLSRLRDHKFALHKLKLREPVGNE